VKKPEWQYKTRFAIQDRMVDVIKKTIDACRAEQKALRKKIKKIQYGS